MTGKQVYEVLGDVNDKYITEAMEYKVKKKPIWLMRAAVAACLCIALLGGVFAYHKPAKALNFYQSVNQYGTINLVAQSKSVTVGDRSAYYYKTAFTNSNLENDLLKDWVGNEYITDGECVWYYPKGVDILADLILKDSDGKYSLWRFVSFVVDEGGSYTYGEVMSEIYGVNSTDDIASIVTNPSRENNTELGMQIQKEIGTHTYTDRAQIEAFYEIAKNVICYGEDSRNRVEVDYNRFSYSFSTTAQDKMLSGETIYGSRWLEIQFANGSQISCLKYNALYGGFSEFFGIYSELLTDEDVYKLNSIFGIA